MTEKDPEKFSAEHFKDRSRTILALGKKTYNLKSSLPRETCDSGGYYMYDFEESTRTSHYVNTCGKPAVYKYVHTGKGQENWKNGFRCEQHTIPEREDLKQVRI